MAEHPDIDRGWAWVILLVASFNILIGSGLAIVCGIFQALFLEQFKESVAYTAWVTALFASLLQLTGPVSSLVSNYFSCRVSVMLGGALLSLGLALSSFANSLDYLLVTFGVISGLGLGLTYTPSIVITNYYFHAKRNLMTGVVMSAAGIGVFVAPLLSRYLLDEYNWREALLFLAAASVQLCVCGAFMFPMHETLECIRFGKSQITTSISSLNNTNTSNEIKETDDDMDQDSLVSTNKELWNSNGDLTCEVTENTVNDTGSVGIEDTECLSSHHLLNPRLKEIQWINSNGSLFFNSQLHLSRLNDTECNKNINHESHEKLNKFRFLWNITFWAVCLNLFLTNAMVGAFFIHYPLWCKSHGAIPSDIALAISTNGPALTLFRCLVGALGNNKNVDYLIVYIALKACGGIFLCLIPMIGYSVISSIMVMIVLALFIGSCDSLNVGITVDCIGLDQLASGVGMQMVCAGFGCLITPPFVGWIVDVTGIYDNTMYISGCFVIAAAVVCLMIPLLQKKGAPPIGYHPEGSDIIMPIKKNEN